MTKQPLSDRLDLAVADAQKRVEQFQQMAADRVQLLEDRYKKFDALREHIREDLGLPRINDMLTRFEGAQTTPNRHREGGELEISFLHCPDCPASVRLRFSTSHDEQLEKLFLDYELNILPIFVEFEKHSRLEIDIDNPNDAEIEAWLDDRLVAFTKTYLQLNFVRQYQEATMVTDPVAKIRVPKQFVKASAEYNGAEYFFASDAAKVAFEKDPARYVAT